MYARCEGIVVGFRNFICPKVYSVYDLHRLYYYKNNTRNGVHIMERDYGSHSINYFRDEERELAIDDNYIAEWLGTHRHGLMWDSEDGLTHYKYDVEQYPTNKSATLIIRQFNANCTFPPPKYEYRL